MTAKKQRLQLPSILVGLPMGSNGPEITAALAKIALENGFFSNNRPKAGSIGYMLFALATGRAMIVNLEPEATKEETPPDKK